jgi:diadenosine tetraphosphate (Ap4A) HIT family hydrolase
MNSYSEKPCLFCAITADRIVLANELAYAIHDGFPVTALHALVIPRRHAATYFDLTTDEILGCDDLLRKVSEKIKSSDSTVAGFNIGLNAGEVAGQTIFHCHFHLIPRRKGDVENPRGGVRHLIPGKGYY